VIRPADLKVHEEARAGVRIPTPLVALEPDEERRSAPSELRACPLEALCPKPPTEAGAQLAVEVGALHRHVGLPRSLPEEWWHRKRVDCSGSFRAGTRRNSYKPRSAGIDSRTRGRAWLPGGCCAAPPPRSGDRRRLGDLGTGPVAPSRVRRPPRRTRRVRARFAAAARSHSANGAFIRTSTADADL
jgi:hypothetical protein